MAFIYDLTDTWNNAGISFNGIKLNATDTASAAGSKLLDLQINGASKLAVGKTGTVTATGIIESTVGGFKFPDATTQTTKATVNSVSGTGSVNGITLTGSVTNSGSLTLGGTLGNIANNQLTNSAITINGTSTALGGSIAVGTVTSVGGTGTVSGLSLTGSVTTSGSLTLGGTLVLTSGQVTDGLGYTPYNATNPAGYTTNVGTVTSVAGTGTVNGLTLTGSVTTSGSLTLGGTLGNIANSQLTNSAITINGTSTALGGSISVGTVTSVAALTLGTSGTDLASSVANGTTTPVITLNVPTASATNRGALSSSDWSTFNAKQAALVSGTNIKTVGGASLLGSGDVGTIGLAYGGTGATTDSGARTALGLGTAAVLNSGVAGGVATLDGSGTVPTSQLPGAVLGGLNYQGTWNASTNVPTLASSVGSKGYYYVVSTAGSTNLNGITDWKIGDWAVYDGSTWQKVDNTDAVSSVNGFTGAVVLTTTDVAQGTNLYFTQAAARGSVSAGTGINYNSTSGVITNSAPDQTVALTGAGTTVVTGTYPNFTITSNDSIVGTVTSVAASGGTTGLSFTGSPITTAGTLTLGGTLALANGGTGATTASGARTALELGTAATTDASAYATAAQGAKADTAVQTIASTDGSVTITGTTAIDLSVGVAGSTSNVILPIRNTTGATLTKGTAVYISGATGQLSTVSKAIANSDATSAQTLGLVTANISNNANGNVTLIGTITNIDTSAYTDGQQLYLSPTTAGTLTATKPHAPQHLVYVAIVEHAHPSQGKLFVKVQNGYEMDELHDVSAQSPANNDGLFYSTSTDLWEKKSIATALGYTPYNATNPAGYTTNTGTVTSVGGTGTVSGLTLTGTVTTSGNLTLGGTLAVTPSNFASQTANTVLAAPNGAAGVPTFRAIVAADIPTLNQNTTGTASNVTGTVAVANGGTGATTLTSGYLLKGNGTSAVSASVVYDDGTNVGIGTASPAAPLNVVRDNTAFRGQLSLQTVSAANFAQITFYNQSTLSAQIYQGYGANKEINIVNPLAAGIALWTTNTERMRITSAGDVGVGTSSPSGKLQVEASNSRLLIGSGGSDNYYDADFHIFRGALSASAPERMRIDNNGQVGIGTASPQALFTISSGSGTKAVWQTTRSFTTNRNFQLAVDEYVEGAFTITPSTTLGGSTYTTPAVAVTGAGNVGIGATTTNGKLTIKNPSASGDQVILNVQGASNTQSIGRISYNQTDDTMRLFNESTFAGSGLLFGTSNTERMRIDTSGNVGIGTTAPVGKLTTVSTSAFAAPNLLCTDNVSNFRIVFNTGSYAGVPANKPWLHSYDDIYVGSDANTAFNVMSGGVNTFKVTSAGLVGIGTSSPAAKLDVVHNQAAFSYFDYSNTTNGGGVVWRQIVRNIANSGTTSVDLAKIGGGFLINNNDTNAANFTAFGVGASERMRIDSSGNLLVGTTSAVQRITLLGNLSGNDAADNGIAILRAGTTYGSNLYHTYSTTTSSDAFGLTVNDNTTLTNALYTKYLVGSNGVHVWYGANNTAERMRIDSSGRVLIGATAVASYFDGKLNVAGYSCFRVSGSSITPVQILWNDADTGDNEFISFFTNSGANFRGGITYNRTAGLTAYNTTSDYRAKDILGPVTDAGATIDALKIYNGKMKGATIARPMLVAHEAQEVVPYAVTGEKDAVNEDGTDKYQQMDHQSFIPLLIAEIQSLRARVAQLEGN